MAAEMLEREDLSIYVVAGVPKSFKKKLLKFVDAESKADGEVMLLDEDRMGTGPGQGGKT